MPTVEAPKKTSPMEMAPVDSRSQQPVIVDKQPSTEPRPDAEPQMSMRGGGMNLGFDCCGGSCRFNKHCC
ncbi:Fc.00g079560.m01.CDS01 [Cosmosporella sp. VM-42]